MKIIKANDYNDMSRKVANILSAQVILKPNAVLGLATGGTVAGAYKQLIEWNKKGDVDFSKVRTVNLDEYVGIPPTNVNSYRYYINTNFVDHVNIDKSKTFLPNGLADNLQDECIRFENLIEELGGIDMQLLGIGLNGHIGFNEPNKHFVRKTNLITLSQSTIKANAKYFEEEKAVPKQAITMGLKTIMMAKKIVLAVSGSSKAIILKEALTGKVIPTVPASILQMHPDVTVVADADALAEFNF